MKIEITQLINILYKLELFLHGIMCLSKVNKKPVIAQLCQKLDISPSTFNDSIISYHIITINHIIQTAFNS